MSAVRLLVLDGRLPAGTRLPAERELASMLSLSRTTVGAALDDLRTSGLVISRRGAGTWIALPEHTPHPPEAPSGGESIDLARAAPEALPGTFSAFETAATLMREHLRHTGYHDRGLPELRAALAERYRARGLPTAPEQIVITNGAHAGFVLTLRALVSPGDRVLVEQPGYPNATDAVRGAHATPVPVACDASGWSVESLGAAISQAGPRLAYLVPDFQNPTGALMDTATRTRIGELLRNRHTLAVADETLLELDFRGPERRAEGPPPLATAAPDEIITLGSASKSYWGGLRLGWVRAPVEICDRIVGARTAVDLGAPVFEQLVLRELLDSSGAAVEDRRAEFAARRNALMSALREHCPQWSFPVPEGGLSLWCTLDAPISTRLAVAAENHGIRLAPGARFGVHGGMERNLRIPFALPPEQLSDAARQLAAVAATLSDSPDGLRVPVT